MRQVLARYHDMARFAIERHGGTVEKFIGDAVMAVFGVPVVREDDALRAVRAALDIQEAIAVGNDELDAHFGVRLRVRIGVNTGEVVVGAGTDAVATGDAINVAARLEQAAGSGEVLVGEATWRLVRGATRSSRRPLTLKGKAEPVIAYRVLGLVEGAEAIARRLDSPLVGRRRELDNSSTPSVGPARSGRVICAR